jgi:protein required for attachment to host cells
MSGHALYQGTWVAVCDSATALLLENMGDHASPNLVTREIFKHDSASTHEQGTSPPGRTNAASGGRRSAMESPDFHLQAEQAFLRHFAENLDRHVQQQKIGALLLIAPPRALGFLRKALSDATRRVVAGELAHDYVKLSLAEIEHRLAGGPA